MRIKTIRIFSGFAFRLARHINQPRGGSSRSPDDSERPRATRTGGEYIVPLTLIIEALSDSVSKTIKQLKLLAKYHRLRPSMGECSLKHATPLQTGSACRKIERGSNRLSAGTVQNGCAGRPIQSDTGTATARHGEVKTILPGWRDLHAEVDTL